MEREYAREEHNDSQATESTRVSNTLTFHVVPRHFNMVCSIKESERLTNIIITSSTGRSWGTRRC